jgi:hypothetical protein
MRRPEVDLHCGNRPIELVAQGVVVRGVRPACVDRRSLVQTRMGDDPVSDDHDIVYGIDNNSGDGAFARRARAEAYQRLGTILSARTWGEVRARLSPAEVEEVRERYSFEGAEADDPGDADDPDHQPGDAEPFDFDSIIAFQEGDWPLPPIWDALEWFPADLAARFGRKVTTTLNGDYLAIEPGQLEQAADALGALGYRCTRDDGLVANWA